MTDLETIRAMLSRAGVEYEAKIVTGDSVTGHNDVVAGHSVTVEDGYPGFVAILDFDVDGALLRISAWE